MKNLYTESGVYNQTAKELSGKVSAIMGPLIGEYIKEGYKHYELDAIITSRVKMILFQHHSLHHLEKEKTE